MVVGIHQLHYLPWLRYIHKLICADVFIVLDNIQYNKNGHQNRNRIKSPQGDLCLTVPVFDQFAQSLDQVRIDNKRPWARKHWRSIAQHYGRAPYFDEHAAWLSAIYERPWEKLNDLNRTLLTRIIEELGIETPLIFASDLDVSGEATERLVGLVHAVGGTAYLSGAHAVESYLDRAALEEANIALHIQHWTAPAYSQCSAPFVPDLSILDLMMNCGPKSRGILEGARP
ncbi:MAG: WbqC family protein [Candidatus Hydrogenedentes bacterium]|nr:WbqC family protein [Candidatus Hydrogenedentota bacterium]